MANKSLIGGIVTVLLSTGTLAAQEYSFKLHHPLSAASLAHTQLLEPWAERVEERSGGAIDIEIFPAMTLGGRPPELIQQSRDGVVDLIWTLNGYTPGLFPRAEVFELPTVFKNDLRAANLAMYDMFESDLKEDFKGVEVMFLHVHGGQGLHTRGIEARSPDDLKGAKLRIPSRIGAWTIEALGASPVAMPVPELPPALQKGVVDGAFIPWEIIPPLKIQDQTDYQIEMYEGERFGTATFQVSMNGARWNSLPPEIQAHFKDASDRDWWGEVGDIWAAGEDFGIDLAVKAGNEHIVLNEEETAAFREAMLPVVDRWIDEVSSLGVDGADMVARARAAIAENTDK